MANDMKILKYAFRELRYPTKKFEDEGDIPEGKSYVILNMDDDTYFSYWVSKSVPAFSGTHHNAKTYTRGYGDNLHDDVFRLRKLLYRVTVTDESMGWK